MHGVQSCFCHSTLRATCNMQQALCCGVFHVIFRDFLWPSLASKYISKFSVCFAVFVFCVYVGKGPSDVLFVWGEVFVRTTHKLFYHTLLHFPFAVFGNSLSGIMHAWEWEKLNLVGRRESGGDYQYFLGTKQNKTAAVTVSRCVGSRKLQDCREILCAHTGVSVSTHWAQVFTFYGQKLNKSLTVLFDLLWSTCMSHPPTDISWRPAL